MGLQARTLAFYNSAWYPLQLSLLVYWSYAQIWLSSKPPPLATCQSLGVETKLDLRYALEQQFRRHEVLLSLRHFLVILS